MEILHRITATVSGTLTTLPVDGPGQAMVGVDRWEDGNLPFFYQSRNWDSYLS